MQASGVLPLVNLQPNPPLNSAPGMNNVQGLQMAALQLVAALSQVPQQSSNPLGNINPADLASLLASQTPQPVAQSGASGNSSIGPPVGSFPNDDDLLVAALQESDSKGRTYRQALEGLHGVNNHIASQWKDYYLDHAHRINKRVSKRVAPENHTVVAKKPSFDTPSVSQGSARAFPVKKPFTTHRDDARESHQHNPEKSNSGRKDKGKAVADSTIQAPTPPQHVSIRRDGRHTFTQEDQEYLVNYAKYRTQLNPQVTKSSICEGLAATGPHHTAASWQSHWASHRFYYDAQVPHFADHQPSADFRHDQTVDSGSDYSEGEDVDSETDVKNMGPRGGSITKADKRVIARYVVSFGREWASMKRSDRWEPFEAMYPQRGASAWAETYRRYESEIMFLAKKFRKRQQSVQSQTGRPTWAHNKSNSPLAKRNYSVSDHEHDGSSSKRARAETSG